MEPPEIVYNYRRIPWRNYGTRYGNCNYNICYYVWRTWVVWTYLKNRWNNRQYWNKRVALYKTAKTGCGEETCLKLEITYFPRIRFSIEATMKGLRTSLCSHFHYFLESQFEFNTDLPVRWEIASWSPTSTTRLGF